MGHSSTDMRTPTLTYIHTRISRGVTRHNPIHSRSRTPIHTATHHTDKPRDTFTDPRFRRTRFRARIRGSRPRCVRRLRRVRVVPRVTVTAIGKGKGKGIDTTHAPWVGVDESGRSATHKGIRHEDSLFCSVGVFDLSCCLLFFFLLFVLSLLTSLFSYRRPPPLSLHDI